MSRLGEQDLAKHGSTQSRIYHASAGARLGLLEGTVLIAVLYLKSLRQLFGMPFVEQIVCELTNLRSILYASETKRCILTYFCRPVDVTCCKVARLAWPTPKYVSALTHGQAYVAGAAGRSVLPVRDNHNPRFHV